METENLNQPGIEPKKQEPSAEASFKTDSEFDYSSIPTGFYDEVYRTGHPIRRAWHVQKFERVKNCLPEKMEKLLDIGCFSGSFLSQFSEEAASLQLGVDILPEQIDFAQRRYGTAFRHFQHIRDLSEIGKISTQFDTITLIEVIEHLSKEEINVLFTSINEVLKPGGSLVFSTPNYISTWPILEIILNKVSDVSYEEQHITKFHYFNMIGKLAKIYPELHQNFTVDFVTTTHFISPFLAGISMNMASNVSKLFKHEKWHLPFGNLILIKITKKS